MSQTIVNKCWEVYNEKDRSLEMTQSISIEEGVFGPQRKIGLLLPQGHMKDVRASCH